MMPQGWRAARSTWAALNPRPARSGPNPPSPLRPWQSLQSVNLGASLSQYAFPAAASPAGWAEAVCASGSISTATNIFFMGFPPEGKQDDTQPAPPGYQQAMRLPTTLGRTKPRAVRCDQANSG